MQSMEVFFDKFTALSRISARFAARLVQAGALTALHCLAEQLKRCREEAGASAATAIARTEKIVMDCLNAVAREVPRVSCRDCYCWTGLLCLSGCRLWASMST